MTHSHRTAVMALTLASLALCQGCVGDPAYRLPIKLTSNTDIQVVRATARRTRDGVIVGGDVRRPNGYAGVVPGHLFVVGRDASGYVVSTTDAAWGEFKNRRFRLAYFKAFLPSAGSSAIATVTVEPITRGKP